MKQLARSSRRKFEAPVTNLKEHASQIQKVSAQLATASPSHGGLEVSKFATGRIRRGGPAPETIANNRGERISFLLVHLAQQAKLTKNLIHHISRIGIL